MALKLPTLPLLPRLLLLSLVTGSLTVGAPLALQALANWRLEGKGQQIAIERLERTQRVIHLLQQPLLDHVVDYGTWTDLWAFAQDPDLAWAETNLGPWLNRTQGLDLVWVLDPDGDLVYAYRGEGIPDVSADEWEMWQQLYTSHPALYPPQLVYWQRGSQMYAMAAIGIARTDDLSRRDPGQGLYGVGWRLDEGWLQQLKDLTLEDYLLWDREATFLGSTFPAHDQDHLHSHIEQDRPEEFLRRLQSNPNLTLVSYLQSDFGRVNRYRLLPEDRFAGYLPLRGIDDQLVGLLQIHFTVPTWIFVPFDLDALWAGTMGAGLGLFGLSAYLLIRWVLAPVHQMQKAALRFDQQGSQGWSCDLPAGNEMGDLCQAFGHLVGTLQTQMQHEQCTSQILSIANRSGAIDWDPIGKALQTQLNLDQVWLLRQDPQGGCQVLCGDPRPWLTWTEVTEWCPGWMRLLEGEVIGDPQRLALPLWVHDRVWGGLVLQGDPVAIAHLHSVQGSRWVDHLAEQLATALERQHLLSQIQAQAQELHNHNQTLEDWISALAHDLRNPLFSQQVALTSMVERLQKALLHEGSLSAEQQEKLLPSSENSLAINRAMAELVENLLNIARYRAGRKRLYPAPIDWQVALSRPQEILESIIGAKDLTIRVSLDPHLPSIEADPGELYRLIQNLLVNAIEHSPPGGEIQMQVDPYGDGIRFQCGDAGPGIPVAEQAQLFQRFHQAGRIRKGSTGMGLYLCRQIVESHGGQIGLISAPGQGSLFWFTLPCRIPADRNPVTGHPQKIPFPSRLETLP